MACIDSEDIGNSSTDSVITPEFNNSMESNNISCRDDFFLQNGTCYPRCDRFEQHPHVAIQTMLTAEIIAASIATLVSITALILSVYNRKNMQVMP